MNRYQGYILLLASFFTHFYLVRHKGTQHDCFSHDVTNKERIQDRFFEYDRLTELKMVFQILEYQCFKLLLL